MAGLRDRDITDIYAFHPPGFGSKSDQDLSKMVLVLAVNPLSPAGISQVFSDEAEYLILVDTDGDAKEDIEMEIEFSKLKNGRQKVEVELEGGEADIEGKGRTEEVISLKGGGKFFAGLRDDPFFFDLGILLGTSTGGTDTFAGSNVSAMVLEVPTSALLGEDDDHDDDDDDDHDGNGGTTTGVWGAVKGSGQIDRVGIPTVSTVLIPSGRKDLYNASKPKKDVKNFTADIIGTLMGAPFGRTVTDATAIAGVLLPDILPVDVSSPTEFTFFNAGPVVLNGRNLDDDVIDSVLRLVFGSDGATDGVGGNDVPFMSAFPYLAPPH